MMSDDPRQGVFPGFGPVGAHPSSPARPARRPSTSVPPVLSPSTKSKLPLTAEQIAIVDLVGSGKGYVLVEALAGSGKTSTIIESLSAVTARRVLLCAFNKANQEALEARMGKAPRGRVQRARTFHGLGLAILKSYGCKADVDRDATEALVNAVADAVEQMITNDRRRAMDDGMPSEMWIPWFPVSFLEGTEIAIIKLHIRRSALTLLRRVKETCVDLDVSTDDIEQIGYDIDAFTKIDDVCVPLTCMIARLAYLSGMRLDRDVIDHCDMIWLPMVLALEPKSKFDLVFVDEGQDLSRPQFELVRRVVAPDGRLVVVGDLYQSVYGWRGAVGDEVWDQMLEAQATAMPLTVSFRCARAIVDEARELVPALRPCASAPLGDVRSCSFTQMLRELPSVTSPCFVLSRNNADLFQTAIQLWRQRDPFYYHKSEEMAAGLRAIIDRLDVYDTVRFPIALEDWYATELAKAEARSAVAWADRIDQQYEMILSLLEHAEPKNIVRLLEDLVKTKSKQVTLSTVHGAKGFEAPRVYLLRQTFARHQDRTGNDSPISQEEYNLEYVAITRAQRELVWTDLDELKIMKAQRRLRRTKGS